MTMAGVSQKCQYGLRALLELAKRYGEGFVKVGEIARAQAIPVRFLTVILAELRQGEFVVSRRVAEGGYRLARSPESLTVGEAIRFIEGPMAPVECLAAGRGKTCPLRERCAFMGMWRRARDAVAHVYDSTSFRDLLEAEAAAGAYVPSYCI